MFPMEEKRTGMKLFELELFLLLADEVILSVNVIKCLFLLLCFGHDVPERTNYEPNLFQILAQKPGKGGETTV